MRHLLHMSPAPRFRWAAFPTLPEAGSADPMEVAYPDVWL